MCHLRSTVGTPERAPDASSAIAALPAAHPARQLRRLHLALLTASRRLHRIAIQRQ